MSILEQHAAQITHVCPDWMSVVNGIGDLQIDADWRLPKLCAAKGIALMPLLTNLVGDTWQPEAIENLAHGSVVRQDQFIRSVLTALRNARAAGVVIDWEQIDPAYKEELAVFLDEKGAYHALSPKCTHMGCTVGWNATDRTWDCPCHGSRYGISGEVLKGPAAKALAKADVGKRRKARR